MSMFHYAHVMASGHRSLLYLITNYLSQVTGTSTSRHKLEYNSQTVSEMDFDLKEPCKFNIHAITAMVALFRIVKHFNNKQ